MHIMSIVVWWLPYVALFLVAALVLLLVAIMKIGKCRTDWAADVAQLLHSIATCTFLVLLFALVYWLLPNTSSPAYLCLEVMVSIVASLCLALMFWVTTYVPSAFLADWLAGGYPFPYPDHPSWRRTC